MPWFIYAVLAAVLFLFDHRVYGYYLVSIGTGMALSALASLLGFSLSLQLVTLVFGALVSLFFIRPVLVKTGKASRSYVRSLIGRSAVLTDPIDRTGFGHLRIDGVIWNAVSEMGEEIGRGEEVIIRDVADATLYVVKKQDTKMHDGGI